MKKLNTKLATLVAAGVGAMAAAPAAMAQTSGAVDVAAIVTKITDQATPIGLLGAAVLTIFVTIKAFKWVRRGMS